MTRKLSLLLAGLVACAAAPAMAQNATGTVTVLGNVDARCQVVAPTNKTINVGEMTGTTGILDPTRINGRTETLNVWCNQASATMDVEALPLSNTATGAAGFTNRVDYVATAVLGTASATDTSAAAGAGLAAGIGLSAGDITVTLSASQANGGPRLIAGAYQGSVLVTIRPNAIPPST
jgi:hypothetical protein